MHAGACKLAPFRAPPGSAPPLVRCRSAGGRRLVLLLHLENLTIKIEEVFPKHLLRNVGLASASAGKPPLGAWADRWAPRHCHPLSRAFCTWVGVRSLTWQGIEHTPPRGLACWGQLCGPRPLPPFSGLPPAHRCHRLHGLRGRCWLVRACIQTADPCTRACRRQIRGMKRASCAPHAARRTGRGRTHPGL